MATQRTQRDDEADRISSIAIVVSSLVVYIIVSITCGLFFSVYVGSFLSNLLSFSVLGIIQYIVLHFLLPDQMSKVDTRLLHELAKRKLIEFRE